MRFFLFYFLLISIYLTAQNNPDRTFKIDSLKQTRIDSLMKRDSVSFKNAKQDTIKPKQLVPVKQQPVNSLHSFLSNEKIIRTDYRNGQQILNMLPFVYMYDLGQPIQYNNASIYGVLPSNMMIIEDGIPIHNGIFNDLNFIQSEGIDSIEAIPVTQGLFYGNYKNYAQVNIINKEPVYTIPYSRIKYYQGPTGEGFIDGIFNIFLAKKFNAILEVSNRKVDTYFTNNRGAIWNGKIKLRYLFNDELNLTGSYSYSDLKTDFNGGVQYDRIVGGDKNLIFYDNQQAPVVYGSRHFNNRQHRFYIKTLYNPNTNSHTEFSVYSNFNRDNIDGDTLYLLNDIQTYGAIVHSYYNLKNSRVKVYGNYESSKYKYLYPSVNTEYNNYSISCGLGFDFYFLDSTITLSPFAKLEEYNFSNTENTYPYIGSDLLIKLNSNISAGMSYGFTVSERDFFNDLVGKNLSLFEASLNINYPRYKGSVRYFNKFVDQLSPNLNYTNLLFLNNMILFKSNKALSGINLSFEANPGKVLVENSFTYYHNRNSGLVNLPEYNLNCSVFFKDSLFNSNLDLKTGLIAKYIGTASYFLNYGTTGQKNVIINPAFTLDFTLSGMVQKTAVLYFTLENILDKQYFLVPYYPMRGIGYRFGVSWEIFN